LIFSIWLGGVLFLSFAAVPGVSCLRCLHGMTCSVHWLGPAHKEERAVWRGLLRPVYIHTIKEGFERASCVVIEE
jgi:hypothetical protein